MNSVAMLIAFAIVLPAVVLVAWVGHAMSKANDDLRSFVGFQGLHFDE